MIGQFVTSIAGHDKGCVYLVVREEGKYVYLSDGKYKSYKDPKKKSLKHVQWIKKFCSKEISDKIAQQSRLQDEEIKREIKLLLQQNNI